MRRTQLPLSERPYLFATVPVADIHYQLVDDIEHLYGRVRDLRDIELTDVWLLARDLVLAIERWGSPIRGMEGATKMNVATEVAWVFASRRGGVAALRDRVSGAIPYLPGWMGRWLLGRLLNETTARKLIQFVLELAVREMKKVSGFTLGDRTQGA